MVNWLDVLFNNSHIIFASFKNDSEKTLTGHSMYMAEYLHFLKFMSEAKQEVIVFILNLYFPQ